MNNNLTELVFILDRSGSMHRLVTDTIGGFNSMLSRQKEQPGEAYVSTFLFSSDSQLLHDRLNLRDVPEMTERDYRASGSTALIDAIGGAIKHISNIHKYARPEDVPAHTLFIITTDGMENASHCYTSTQVKEMIRQQEEQGWEFLFIGANIDAVETAAHIGIRRDRAANYHADKRGTETLYACLSKPISAMRAGEGVSSNWSESLKEDFDSRK